MTGRIKGRKGRRDKGESWVVKAPICLKTLSLSLADHREQQLDSTAHTLEHLEEHALPCQTDWLSIFALALPATDYLTVGISVSASLNWREYHVH